MPWNILCNSLLEKQMGQSIQEWTKYNLWKTTLNLKGWDMVFIFFEGPFFNTWTLINIVIVWFLPLSRIICTAIRKSIILNFLHCEWWTNWEYDKGVSKGGRGLGKQCFVTFHGSTLRSTGIFQKIGTLMGKSFES